MKIEKGEIRYYLYRYKDSSITWAILKAVRDYEGQHGLGSSWLVLQANREYNEGDIYSANQFDGIGTDGLDKYTVLTKRKAIKTALYFSYSPR